MSYATVQDWQLLSFFEVEPTFLDPDALWPYTDAVYQVDRDGLMLSFAIQPAYRHVRIVLERNGIRLYELNAMDVEDVRYNKDDRMEWLEIALSPMETITLRLKPHIEIEHRSDGRRESQRNS